MNISPRLLLATFFVLALAVRVGPFWAMPSALIDDPDAYRALATNVWQYGVFGEKTTPTVFRPPLYPLVLVPAVTLGDYTPAAIALLHFVLGMATIVLTYALARRLDFQRPMALLAAALVACDPILLMQSTQVMTETLATLLVVAGLWVLALRQHTPTFDWKAVALSGGLLALAALCRPSLIVWLALVGVAVPWLVEKWPNRLKFAAVYFLAAAVVLSPWAIRNQIQFGRAIVTTTHGGYTLCLANNREFYEYLRSGASSERPWDATSYNRIRDKFREPGETKDDRAEYSAAWDTIQANPGDFFSACVYRVRRFWGVMPYVSLRGAYRPIVFRWAVAAWYVAEFLLAVVGLIVLVRRRAWRNPFWLSALLLAVSLTAIHAVFWSNMRMRAPLTPLIALAACVGLSAIYGRQFGRKPQSSRLS